MNERESPETPDKVDEPEKDQDDDDEEEDEPVPRASEQLKLWDWICARRTL